MSFPWRFFSFWSRAMEGHYNQNFPICCFDNFKISKHPFCTHYSTMATWQPYKITLNISFTLLKLKDQFLNQWPLNFFIYHKLPAIIISKFQQENSIAQSVNCRCLSEQASEQSTNRSNIARYVNSFTSTCQFQRLQL